MMNPLNSTMLATALTTICTSFGKDVSAGALLITPLYVTCTVGQPLMGRLADIYSPKKINTLGFVLVLIAAVIGMIAPDFSWLIVSRIILGLGTSAAYPSAMAIINKKYANEGIPVPGKVMGWVAICSQISMVLGPVLGGLLTQWLGWKGIFFINIPWVIAAVYLSKSLPDEPPIQQEHSLFKELDIPGILLFSTFLLVLLFTLMQHNLFMYYWPVLFLSLALLILWERKQENPFIHVRLLWSKSALSLVYIRTLATNYILYLILYAMPQWIEGVLHVSPANTGLMMFPMSLMSAMIGWLVSRSSNIRLLYIGGLISLSIACGCLFLLTQYTAVIMVVGATLIMGVAVGINMIANQSALQKEADKSQTGVSFGLYRTAGYIGAIVSGSQLKTGFKGGVTDASFHQLALYASISCILSGFLLIPLWMKPSTKIYIQ
jgi:MFS family permease